ncbi:unnamed protein product, partial [Lepidochelys olivacea]
MTVRHACTQGVPTTPPKIALGRLFKPWPRPGGQAPRAQTHTAGLSHTHTHSHTQPGSHSHTLTHSRAHTPPPRPGDPQGEDVRQAHGPAQRGGAVGGRAGLPGEGGGRGAARILHGRMEGPVALHQAPGGLLPAGGGRSAQGDVLAAAGDALRGAAIARAPHAAGPAGRAPGPLPPALPAGAAPAPLRAGRPEHQGRAGSHPAPAAPQDGLRDGPGRGRPAQRAVPGQEGRVGDHQGAAPRRPAQPARLRQGGLPPLPVPLPVPGGAEGL